MKAVVAAFNQEKALVGAFSVIVQPVVEPMDRFTALAITTGWEQSADPRRGGEHPRGGGEQRDQRGLPRHPQPAGARLHSRQGDQLHRD